MYFPSRNPRKRKRFPHWFELRQDILFNGLNLKEAAKKYDISPTAISLHLKEHLRIKEAYYSRPWATLASSRQAQIQIQFYPQICIQAQEAIEDVYSKGGPPIYNFESDLYKQSLFHLTNCDSCQAYELEVKEKANVPYRFDCPPLSTLLESSIKNNVALTEHFLVCPFCKIEYDGINFVSPERAQSLVEKEFDFYPYIGWTKFLKSHQIIETVNIISNPLFKKEGIPPNFIRNIPNKGVQAYFRWRIFRTPIFEMGLST